MKKILAFLSAAIFVGSSTLAVSACGVSKGQEVKAEIKNPPKEATEGEDPLVDYVYNNKYIYSSINANYLLAVAGQLTIQKIRDNQDTLTSETWKEFYNSHEWQRGYFSSINYDLTGITPVGEHDFSYSGANNRDFIVQVKNNDLSDDTGTNIVRTYWYITSDKPWSASNPGDYQPTKNNIVVPDPSEFTNEITTITKTGWIHFYLMIANFKIDFSAKINFTFLKLTDKNQQSGTILSLDTFRQPFGKIDFNHPEIIYNDAITNLEITKS